jgi:hypothetical protein
VGKLDLAKYVPNAAGPYSRFLLLFLLTFPSGPAVAAQEDGPYGYAVYFQCAPQNVDAVDASVADVFGPALDRMVKDGDLLAWGWVARHTGGQWDRELYFVTPTLTEAVTQLDRWREANARERRAEVAVLLSACPAQEEYIWRYLMGSKPRVEAPIPSAEFVTYYECDGNRGEQADEIVRSVFRPLLDAEVTAGAITSWSWHEQVVGGGFTRILIIEGASHVANVQTVDRLGAVLHAKRLEAFGDICGRHQDYLWTIESAKK